jgi:hypothetical protein
MSNNTHLLQLVQQLKQRLGAYSETEPLSPQPCPAVLPASFDASNTTNDPLFQVKYMQQAYCGSVVAIRQTLERQKLEKELQNQKAIGLYSRHANPEYAARMDELYARRMRDKFELLKHKTGQHSVPLHKDMPLNVSLESLMLDDQQITPSTATANHQLNDFMSTLSWDNQLFARSDSDDWPLSASDGWWASQQSTSSSVPSYPQSQQDQDEMEPFWMLEDRL